MPGHQGSRREVDYRIIRAQEDERKRLARDLHDGLVQSLASIGINLEVVERHIEADPVRKPEAVALITRLREGIAGCLEEARRILSDLRPLELNGRSLSQALKDHAERVSAEAGLTTTVVISGQEQPLHPSLEAGLFRVFQEALNNIRDHAGAREVSLKLRFLPRSVAMDVADDGAGFRFDGDFETLARQRCFGLLGINERVKLLGGTWRVSSEPGRGSEIRVRLPVEGHGRFWRFLPQLGAVERTTEDGGSRAAAPPRWRGTGRSSEAVSGRTPSGPALRLLIADDHRVVREGLKMIFDLAPGIEVIGEAADGEETLRLARELAPDVALLDVIMPGPGAAETVRRVRQVCPRTVLVAITAHHDPEQVRELLAAGAAGYLLKTAESREIVDAVFAAASGVRPLAAEAVAALSEAPKPTRTEEDVGLSTGGNGAGGARVGPVAPGLAELTLREREVLALVGEGLTNRELGRKLFISEKTVRNHLGAIIRKLGLQDRTQVALVARGLHRAGEEAWPPKTRTERAT